MIYGYCRISTPKQSLERQIKNIAIAYPSAKIITETYTGTTTERPQFCKLLKALAEGDTVVFDSVSRMSRSAEEGFRQYQELAARGIDLVFLKEPYINTSLYREAMGRQLAVNVETGKESIDKYLSGQMKLLNDLIHDMQKEQILIAFNQSEKEVADLRQRTREGMAAKGCKNEADEEGNIKQGSIARAQTGHSRPHKKEAAAKAIIREHYRSFGGSLKAAECQKLAEVSRNTFFKYVAEIEAEK